MPPLNRELHPQWKRILPGDPQHSLPSQSWADDDFVDLSRYNLGSVAPTADTHERRWQCRRGSIHTLVVLFVFRLARTPRRPGYARVLADLWECCRQLGLQLPQDRPVAAWVMCVARAKVGASVFRRIHAVEGAAGLLRGRIQAQPAPGTGGGRLLSSFT